MSVLFKNADRTPLQSTLLESLTNAVPSSALSEATGIKSSKSSNKHDDVCYYGDSSDPSLEFFYGKDIPKSAGICSNGLFSYGDQTQMHSLSIISKYPYLHPVSIIYSLLYLWFIHFRIRILSILIIIIIQFTIGESLKIERHCTLQTLWDKTKMIAQFIGDMLLIPYQCFIHSTESPLIQFQDTSMNRTIFSQCKTMLKFSPTFWCKNTMLQFILAVLEEQYDSWKGFKIYRHCLQTEDGGLIALDFWTQSSTTTTTTTTDKYASFGDIYQSKNFYKPDEARYNDSFPSGDNTPILFIFTTYCGDSMSGPVRGMAKYFCTHGWRVISYTKRGCGSPYFEMLPLTNHKIFDLSGMKDAQLAVEYVSNRYPLAPKVCVGFSLGGSQVHEFLAGINLKCKHFIGGIKIDGITTWSQSRKFNVRHNAISKVLGEVIHSNYIKIFQTENGNEIDYEKVAALQKRDECKGFDFDKLIGVESSQFEFMDVVDSIMSPSYGYDIYKYDTYLHASGPVDIERVDVPMLVINSWNDGFQDPDDMPIGIANTNANVFHCITRWGAHCIRREGILFRNCWQSKVTFEFAEGVLSLYKSHKS